MSYHAKQLILSAGISGLGYHPGATGSVQQLTDLSHYRHLIHLAERGRLDFVLVEDPRALGTQPLSGRIDALTLLARLAPSSSRVGLAASIPTTYSEPFHVSRELATLDFVSGGRAAWNVTTIADADEAWNFGRDQVAEVSLRRSIAEEYIDVSRKLWDSWEDDAVIVDRERGWYIDPAKLHHINHRGAHFSIRGPQITYRPPQGHVVVIQSDHGDSAIVPNGSIADVIINQHPSLTQAQEAYRRHIAQAEALGREVRVLQQVIPIIGRTTEEARHREAELDAIAAVQANGVRSPALRLVGTPAAIADRLIEWFEAHASDGFHLLAPELPNDLELIAEQLVPELQQRGVFRREYTGTTLREHLRLPRPNSQFATVDDSIPTEVAL